MGISLTPPEGVIMLVCTLKANGKLIEAQSSATPGTLIANAVASGYAATDVEERLVSGAEFSALLAGPPPSVDERATVHVDSIDRLEFEVAFDMENRIRAIEAKPALTRAQYRTALISRWKTLN